MKLYFKIKSNYSYEIVGTKLEKEFIECGVYYTFCKECNEYYSFPRYKTKLVEEYDYKRVDNSIYHVYTFRYDPVPRTGKHKHYNFYNYYRRPKTTYEKRWNTTYIEYVRGKRKPNNLVSAYDDISRSDCFIKRSWKKQKIKKQWMKNK